MKPIDTPTLMKMRDVFALAAKHRRAVSDTAEVSATALLGILTELLAYRADAWNGEERLYVIEAHGGDQIISENDVKDARRNGYPVREYVLTGGPK